MRLFVLTMLALVNQVSAQGTKPLIKSLQKPESVALSPKGEIYVSQVGEFGKPGDGTISRLENDKLVEIANQLDDPKGITVKGNGKIYVTDVTKVWEIEPSGKKSVYLQASDFPLRPKFLNDLESDGFGNLFISDTGALDGSEQGAIFVVEPNKKVRVLIDGSKQAPKNPNGLLVDGESFLLNVDFIDGTLRRIRLHDGATEEIRKGLDGGDGIACDLFGRYYVSSFTKGKVYCLPRLEAEPEEMPVSMQSSADLTVTADGKLYIPDMAAGELVVIDAKPPKTTVDQSALPLRFVPAFENLTFEGWTPQSSSGENNEFRPIVLTHFGDGSGKILLATQHGPIYTMTPGQSGEAKLLLDITDRVIYDPRKNEEGLLGVAVHPKFKDNGEVYIYYTKRPGLLSIVSRFKRLSSDPNKLDPKSEEVIMEVKQPFWNHNGGTICFGADGYLYIALGDGGAANDPFGNGQNKSTVLGSILRIDVDQKANGKNYAIPKDNPFLDDQKAKPEIFAYGVRNVWRLAFDPKSGQGWFGDVGQNLWEEVCLLKSGANYGWNLRESCHPFSRNGQPVSDRFVEPIWEYHHNLGKSITGGNVYRGKDHAELDGMYIYGDYVSNRIWAMQYDASKKRVVANREIGNPDKPILSFGQDEQGEVYMLTFSAAGRGIYKLAKK